MAREHANIQIDIWNDPDFRELSAQAQLLYIQLLSSATLTYAGVADWRPRRIAILSQGRTADEVELAMAELQDGLFVVVDDDSEEAFVRSFFKWDGLLQKPNVAKAMVTAWGKVHSLDLKAVIVHELKRLWSQFPEWKGFEVQAVQELCEKDSLDPREYLSQTVPERVMERVPERDAPLLTTNYLLPTTELLATHSALSDEAPFEIVWQSWPKKTEKERSEKEYLKHVKTVGGLAELIAEFGEAYARTTEKQFIPSLAAWLHRKRWTDELPTPRDGGSRVQQGMSVADELRAMEGRYAG